MRRILALVVAVLVLFLPSVTWGKQGTPVTGDSEYPTAEVAVIHENAACSGLSDAVRLARLDVERDRRALAAASDSGDADATNDARPSPSDMQEDLITLEQREAEFNQCATSNNPPAVAQEPQNGCIREPLLNFEMGHNGEFVREVPIWHLPGSPAFFYVSGMTIDADGAPNAYHPDNTGLDDLSNAGGPGNWPGLAKDVDGEPYVQGPDDPYPGYYVSETALADRSKPVNDPARYVDASKIPFIVLPGGMARMLEARPGDFAMVINLNNGKSSHAIFGDVGPSDHIGEGSVALAENIGVRSDARNGGTRRGIAFLVFPGSGNGRPRTIDEINTETERLFQAWGGASQLTACTAQSIDHPILENLTAK